MSRIDELIAELALSAVPYVSITEVSDYIRGITYSKNDETVDGEISVLRANNITLASNTLNLIDVKRVSGQVRVRENQHLRAGDILMCAGSGSKEHIGKVAYIETDRSETFGGFMAVIRMKDATLFDSRFVFHLLTGDTFSNYLRSALSTTTINNLNVGVMRGYRIPVPPLEVQREIVRILDQFTQLEAELEARRRQYEYYRNQLLTFPEGGARWLPMGELGVIFRGKRFTKADYSIDGGIGVIHYGDIYTQYGVSTTTAISRVKEELRPRLRFAMKGDVVFTDVGETVEDVGKAVAWLGDEDVAIHDHCYVIRSNLDASYLSYYMQTTEFHKAKDKCVVRTKVKTLLLEGLKTIRVPVPSLSEQRRIAGILDKFDALVNDLSVGLPAELNARRKQYEYYRDKLLTFRELK